MYEKFYYVFLSSQQLYVKFIIITLYHKIKIQRSVRIFLAT